MVRDDGVTKVVDFGIAKAANRATRTATGMVKGKCSYMSPEQILGGQIDARSDQFSLGTVLWEMCTAQRLFKSDSQFITFRKILEDPIVPPSEVVPEIPGKLDSVVMRMLARDPERRFARCAHVAEALDPFRSQAVSGAAQSVALFVKRVAGKKIKERTHDLTPSDESFFISLRDPPAGPLGSAVGPGREYGPTLPLWPTRKRRRWLGLASALVVAFLGGIGMWVARNATDEAAAQPPDAEAGEEIEAKPSAEEPAGPRGVLLLNSVPTGATVVAGTTVLGTTPVRIDVLAPRVEHQLQIERKGYEPGELRVRLKPGEIREETVMLKRTPRRRSINKARRSVDPPAAQPAFGSVSVDTTPWTQVSIDGLPLGSTPLHKVRLASGKHRLRFVNEQLGVDRSRDIVIRPGED